MEVSCLLNQSLGDSWLQSLAYLTGFTKLFAYVRDTGVLSDFEVGAVAKMQQPELRWCLTVGLAATLPHVFLQQLLADSRLSMHRQAVALEVQSAFDLLEHLPAEAWQLLSLPYGLQPAVLRHQALKAAWVAIAYLEWSVFAVLAESPWSLLEDGPDAAVSALQSMAEAPPDPIGQAAWQLLQAGHPPSDLRHALGLLHGLSWTSAFTEKQHASTAVVKKFHGEASYNVSSARAYLHTFRSRRGHCVSQHGALGSRSSSNLLPPQLMQLPWNIAPVSVSLMNTCCPLVCPQAVSADLFLRHQHASLLQKGVVGTASAITKQLALFREHFQECLVVLNVDTDDEEYYRFLLAIKQPVMVAWLPLLVADVPDVAHTVPNAGWQDRVLSEVTMAWQYQPGIIETADLFEGHDPLDVAVAMTTTFKAPGMLTSHGCPSASGLGAGRPGCRRQATPPTGQRQLTQTDLAPMVGGELGRLFFFNSRPWGVKQHAALARSRSRWRRCRPG